MTNLPQLIRERLSADGKVLDLKGAAVTDLSPLVTLTGLEVLDLTGCNGVTDLSPLSGLSRLRYLWLDQTADRVLGNLVILR